LEVAQNMLSLGEVDAVVVGGVDFCGGLENVLLRQAKEASSSNTAPSLSLNQGQKGWLVGEGAGAVVLQKASTAQANNARVYAVIDAIGAATDQLDVGYQELGSSGYAQQDAQELEQLLNTQLAQKTALGSVKTSFGHTGAASGIAALIKTALCLHHRFIPGIPNWQQPKQAAAFAATNYYFPTKSRPWLVNAGQQRQAVVNGLDGLQVHLSEGVHTSKPKSPLLQGRLGHLFIIKENTEAALRQALNQLEEDLTNQTTLAELAAHLYYNNNQKETRYNLVLLANNSKHLQREIRFMQVGLEMALAEKKPIKTPQGSYFTPLPLGKTGKIAFSYPGSATAYRGLGQDIFQLFPSLHQHFERKLEDMASFAGSHYLHPQLQAAQEAAPNIHQESVPMMCAGVFSSAIYTHLFRDVFGLQPDLAFGYSMGESAGMWYSLEVWNADNTALFRNSDLFANQLSGDLKLLADTWGISCEEAKARWISLVVLADRAKVEALVAQEECCYLSFVNTPQEVIISGDKAACHRVVQALQCAAVAVPFQNIIHHDFCQPIEKELYQMHYFPLEKQPPVQFYSSLNLAPLPMDSAAIAHNSTQLCFRLVDYPATIEQLYEDGVRIFIELGAGNTCSQWTNKILEQQPHLAVSCTQRGKAEGTALLQTLAQLLSHGVPLDLSSLFAKELLSPAPRAFNKAIIVGGLRLFDFLLQNNIQQQFSGICKKGPAAIAPSEATALPPFFSSIQTTITVEKTSASIAPVLTKKKTVGENGLKLQDFKDPNYLNNKTIIFSQEDLEEFAKGKIAQVFGAEYAPIDQYTRRVMLPMHPYLLVSRVTGLKAKLGEFKPSTMQTEYDIPYNAWFTTDGQIPWAVSVESGQCDLLLIAYLGIDFENKGNLVYRLLDCTLTFVDDLPFEGQTLRYDISINSFVRNGENLLFFFSYNCYVEDRLVLKMRNGCAGFFTDEQLEEGLGVVYSKEELAAKINAQQPAFTPLLTTTKTSFSKADLRHLIDGNMELCFESMAYYANGRNPSLRLPPEQILMIDRIISVDLKGGAYGLGYVIAEKDLAPDDWYFPCHFRDDEVLAGSLQAEGGGNLLRFLMLMLGLQRLTKDARYQPIFDLPQKVRCRKQVVPSKDTKLVYRLEVKEIGLVPNPYVIADLEIVSNGVITVHFENLGLQLREKDNPRYLEKEAGVALAPRSEGALLNELDITNFALNNLSEAFGPDFACYDGRTVSRQPNTDLQLISRVLRIEGERLNFKQPSTIYAEYDVPANAWYYQQNASATMPYSILMEIALQPCGLLGAYLGSTLPFADKNLFFRNLDGTGELLELPMGTDWRGKTIHNKAVLVSSVALGGTVLQNYTFELSIDGQVFYQGKSSFGFFPADALAQQVGLDKGKAIAPWYQQQNLAAKDYMRINLDSLYGKMKLFQAPAHKPHYRLAGEQLSLLDHLKIVKDGGKYGKGYIYGHQAINLYDWFFTCHFYQDPVMPGSLGVEAILQAMQTFALQQDLGKGFESPRFVQVSHHKTVWKYRGQILQGVKNMHCEVHFKTIEQRGQQLVIIGDAYLWNEQTRIYQVTDLALGIEEA
jgi:PfaB family protein